MYIVYKNTVNVKFFKIIKLFIYFEICVTSYKSCKKEQLFFFVDRVIWKSCKKACKKRVGCTYLCDLHNPLIGFRPALKLLHRSFCFARVDPSWSHHAKSGPHQPGRSNAYAFIPATDDHRPPHQTLVSEEDAKPAESLYINTLACERKDRRK